MPPPPAPAGTFRKVKTALVFLAIAVAMLFLLYTGYMRIKNSGAMFLIAVLNCIILYLFFHYRRNPHQIPHAPLFSFPSLSRQPRYSHHLAINHADLPEPAISLPPVVPQHLETDAIYNSRSSDGIILERGESSETISTENQEPEISDLADDSANHDQGTDGDMNETWNAIIARGNAKPVRLFTSKQRETNLKPEMKKTKTGKRKEKKKVTESSSYESGDRRAEDWRKEAATGISGEELSHLSEMFIRRQHNHHRIERQESDRRRLVDRLRFRNPVSAV